VPRPYPVLAVDGGRIAHVVAVNLPRPRERGSAGFAALERQLLDCVLGGH